MRESQTARKANNDAAKNRPSKGRASLTRRQLEKATAVHAPVVPLREFLFLASPKLRAPFYFLGYFGGRVFRARDITLVDRSLILPRFLRCERAR